MRSRQALLILVSLNISACSNSSSPGADHIVVAAAVQQRIAFESLPVLETLIAPIGLPTASDPNALGQPQDWWDVSEPLRGRLSALSAQEPAAQPLLLPDGLATISVEELTESASRGLIVFHWAFAAPVISDDGSEALVYYERRCGGLCSSAGVLWLVRDGPSSWRLRSQFDLWTS